MNEDILNMIKIYNIIDLDWMGDKINDDTILTRHHIKKKEDGGEDDISNYAILTENSHHFLNFLEDNYFYEYNEINNLLLNLNKTRTSPDEDYYKKMNSILKIARKKIKNKRRGR